MKTLFRGDDIIPKEKKPTTCIKESYDLIDKIKEHVLMYDCIKELEDLKEEHWGMKICGILKDHPLLKKA